MRILIIEDEARIARRIERMVSHIFEQRQTAITLVDSLNDGMAFLQKNEIDLLFLDLNLNGQDGFEILEAMVAESFQTIIVSAYKEKAIRAFEYGVLDFVAKPFDENRISKACQRISSWSQRSIGVKFLAIKKHGRRSLIDVNDIKYIKGAGIYTELYLHNGKKEIHNKSLEALSMLLHENFERVHKSFLVDMTNAKEILVEAGSKYTLCLEDGDKLPIGRTRYKDLKDRWFG